MDEDHTQTIPDCTKSREICCFLHKWKKMFSIVWQRKHLLLIHAVLKDWLVAVFLWRWTDLASNRSVLRKNLHWCLDVLPALWTYQPQGRGCTRLQKKMTQSWAGDIPNYPKTQPWVYLKVSVLFFLSSHAVFKHFTCRTHIRSGDRKKKLKDVWEVSMDHEHKGTH